MTIKKPITIILIILCVAPLAFSFYNDYKIRDLEYGVKANPLRQKLFIPVIDNNLKATNRYYESIGNYWKSSKEYPHGGEILHYWKMVEPNTKNLKLLLETDAFVKFINDTTFLQLNIFNQVNSNKITKRKGKLFYKFKNRNKVKDEKHLNDVQVDSVLKHWDLTKFIRNK
ncbi:hypothetical protein EZ449_00385 [Pedobacter frigidisoli]|uniref:Uncharacterized protein n=1 Tax=Pedobacter frigidisoli TaxID=2530455 RepID=A0A4R0P921_9SPHI|nr:hypothetical protein [Pedobacter frigidisoli]TCD12542.1 hypothetical protein EZ449_00385 [Pedobacter frigidisoli]